MGSSKRVGAWLIFIHSRAVMQCGPGYSQTADQKNCARRDSRSLLMNSFLVTLLELLPFRFFTLAGFLQLYTVCFLTSLSSASYQKTFLFILCKLPKSSFSIFCPLNAPTCFQWNVLRVPHSLWWWWWISRDVIYCVLVSLNGVTVVQSVKNQSTMIYHSSRRCYLSAIVRCWVCDGERTDALCCCT